MHRIAPAVMLALSLVVLGQAQTTIAGKWKGNTPTGSTIELDLVVKGATLMGTMTRNDERIPLSDGHVSKNILTFKARMNGQIEGFSGELAGDELKVWLDRQGSSAAIVLKRVKRD